MCMLLCWLMQAQGGGHSSDKDLSPTIQVEVFVPCTRQFISKAPVEATWQRDQHHGTHQV